MTAGQAATTGEVVVEMVAVGGPGDLHAGHGDDARTHQTALLLSSALGLQDGKSPSSDQAGGCCAERRRRRRSPRHDRETGAVSNNGHFDNVSEDGIGDEKRRRPRRMLLFLGRLRVDVDDDDEKTDPCCFGNSESADDEATKRCS